MGYYTAYGLSTYGPEESVKAFEKDLIDSTKDEKGVADYDTVELVRDGGVYAKLYDIDTLITCVAARHPDVLVILSGDGEDSDDLWEQRWRGKQTDIHKASILPFTDPNLQTEYEKNNNN